VPFAFRYRGATAALGVGRAAVMFPIVRKSVGRR